MSEFISEKEMMRMRQQYEISFGGCGWAFELEKVEALLKQAKSKGAKYLRVDIGLLPARDELPTRPSPILRGVDESKMNTVGLILERSKDIGD